MSDGQSEGWKDTQESHTRLGFKEYTTLGRSMEEPPPVPLSFVRQAIACECDAIKAMLLQKNSNYGNSALEPVRVFSKASTDEQIRVRLDDKLSRLQRGSAAGEDVEADIIGYLILLRVHRSMTASNK